MSEDLLRLRALSRRPVMCELVQHIEQAKAGDAAAREAICGALIWVGFAAPAAITAVYDVLSNAWLGGSTADADVETGEIDAVDEAPLPESFWQAYAAALAGAEQGYDATTITQTIAALGGALDTSFGALAEQAAANHPGAADAQRKQPPPLIELENLAACPDGSLARDLHDMLVDNGFDAEVLDREAIGLSGLTPALRYLNTRILQMHDVWHLVAGYETTALHEIAISSFQLAQFGHNYSAMFLATVATISHARSPEGFGLLMQITSEAWCHGRSVQPMMAIEWEEIWDTPVEAVRRKLDIKPFESAFPADLFEQLSAA